MKYSAIVLLHAFLITVELSAGQSIDFHDNALYLRGEIVGPDHGPLPTDLGTASTIDDALGTGSPSADTADEPHGPEPTAADLESEPTLLENSAQPTGDEVLPTNTPPADAATSLECKPETSEVTTTAPPMETTSRKPGGYGMVEFSGPITLSLVWRRCPGYEG